MSKAPESTNNKPNKNHKLRKLIFLIAIIISASALISYFILNKNYQIPVLKQNKKVINNQKKPLKINNKNIQTTIEDKGFTRDIQIEELQKKLQKLEIKLGSLELKDELSRIILSFSELRSTIELEENYEVKLQEFSTLSIKDQTLTLKAEELTQILKEKDYMISDINDEFRKSIRHIIILKAQNDQNDKFSDKIKNVIPKLILIRRIDGKIENSKDEIDSKIVKIEKFITKKDYKQALYVIESLDPIYQKDLQKLIRMLKNQVKLHQISAQIFSYLKKVANNV